MIINYHCTSDNALLLSFLPTFHPYFPFHFSEPLDHASCAVNLLHPFYCAGEHHAIKLKGGLHEKILLL